LFEPFPAGVLFASFAGRSIVFVFGFVFVFGLAIFAIFAIKPFSQAVSADLKVDPLRPIIPHAFHPVKILFAPGDPKCKQFLNPLAFFQIPYYHRL
jgi:hypothetical protein